MKNLGNYILLKKIAVGGMAELYKARKGGESGFAKLFAAKMVLPHLAESDEFIKMLVDEAKVASHLDHRNIVRIHDLIKADNAYCIVMEYVRGKDLRKVISRARKAGRPLSVGDACAVVASVLDALSYAHTKKFKGEGLGIVHRDVSPQNIIVTYEGEVKLADFGIARAANRDTETKAGVLKGKFAYMSPEQAKGKAVDARSDIFSLGAVMYEMLTGRKLFSGDSEIGTLRKVWAAKVEPLPSHLNGEVSPRLEAVLLKALSKEPGDRYAGAGEMLDELSRLVKEENIKAGREHLGRYMGQLFRQEIEDELKEDEELLEWVIKAEGASDMTRLEGLVPALPAPPPAFEITDLEVLDATTRKPQPLPPLPPPPVRTPASAALKYGLGSAAALLIFAGIFYKPAPPRVVQAERKVPAAAAAASEVLYPKKKVKKDAAAPAGRREVQGQPVASISSDPAGALVYVDGIYAGKTPLNYRDIEDGKKYTVRVVRAGYQKWSGGFTGSPGLRESLHAELKKESVKDDVWANVFPKTPSSQQP